MTEWNSRCKCSLSDLVNVRDLILYFLCRPSWRTRRLKWAQRRKWLRVLMRRKCSSLLKWGLRWGGTLIIVAMVNYLFIYVFMFKVYMLLAWSRWNFPSVDQSLTFSPCQLLEQSKTATSTPAISYDVDFVEIEVQEASEEVRLLKLFFPERFTAPGSDYEAIKLVCRSNNLLVN